MQNIRACEGATKVVLRGKQIASNSYISKGERLKVTQNLERKRESRRKEFQNDKSSN